MSETPSIPTSEDISVIAHGKPSEIAITPNPHLIDDEDEKGLIEDTPEGDWPSEAMYMNEEGDLIAPGELGYLRRAVVKVLREELLAHDARISEIRTTLADIHEACLNKVPKLSNSEAIRASQANNRRRLEQADSRKRELQSTLKDMGLVD